jgi:hypothetical protein
LSSARKNCRTWPNRWVAQCGSLKPEFERNSEDKAKLDEAGAAKDPKDEAGPKSDDFENLKDLKKEFDNLETENESSPTEKIQPAETENESSPTEKIQPAGGAGVTDDDKKDQLKGPVDDDRG